MSCPMPSISRHGLTSLPWCLHTDLWPRRERSSSMLLLLFLTTAHAPFVMKDMKGLRLVFVCQASRFVCQRSNQFRQFCFTPSLTADRSSSRKGPFAAYSGDPAQVQYSKTECCTMHAPVGLLHCTNCASLSPVSIDIYEPCPSRHDADLSSVGARRFLNRAAWLVSSSRNHWQIQQPPGPAENGVRISLIKRHEKRLGTQ
ncbi:hypothetical protein EDB81DRAFT_257903 [Dactylonectria macrodidyma]|uniref:Uncharacterized protein n=1 Tax=Dactylonectria macrodidyma TaxID=307937 RepID=A0A9P9JMG9_9HYPO|nr:hypothetical protein EDB81DRAFT_257903 [Dactylonectria macrodidyma]